MTPEEIIRKQAAAVTGFNKLKAAEHLEAAAKLLREEAGQKEVTGIAFINARKEEGRKRAAGIFNAMGKAKQDAFNKAITDGGFKLRQKFDAEGIEHYYMPHNPGRTLTIKKGEFRVSDCGSPVTGWTDTKHLQAWVEKQKKK
jgi:hypothetical protein